MGPLGLRSPLSPLPLADLLGDMGGNITNTPGPALPAAGLQSPDLFGGMSLWTGMPWTPPAFNPPLGLPVNAHFEPFSQSQFIPASPIGSYQGFSPLPSMAPPMPSTAPPAAPGMAALGGGFGLGLSPAPGLAPATVGVHEGFRGGGFYNMGVDDKKGIVCDLGKRLASLDVVCSSLAADVRDLTASSSQEPAAAPAGSERLVHRI